MSIKVTTLVENCVRGRGVKGEHGLSMFFETDDKVLLFDTGASDLFLHNAKLLGKRIEDVDLLILSHGHSDHTGGLKAFLEVNSKAKVICKKSILTPKFRGNRENGITNIDILDLSRFVFIDDFYKITNDIYILPNIEIRDIKDTHFSNFELLTKDGRIADNFDDELAIVIVNNNGISIFSACSHRGITNIISSVRDHIPAQKINYLIGGFHLAESTINDTLFISDYLKNDMPTHIGVCHCTGIENYSILSNELGKNVFYNYCGTEIIL